MSTDADADADADDANYGLRGEWIEGGWTGGLGLDAGQLTRHLLGACQ